MRSPAFFTVLFILGITFSTSEFLTCPEEKKLNQTGYPSCLVNASWTLLCNCNTTCCSGCQPFFTSRASSDNTSIYLCDSCDVTKCAINPPPEKKEKKPLLGFMAALCAITFFGSNFVPVKRYNTGDGLFFQWVMCIGVWCTGVIVLLTGFASDAQSGNIQNIDKSFIRFHPETMLGGVLWCTGNIMSVPVIKLIGLSMGLLIWGGSNMLTGWATSRFGIIIPKASALAHPTLNTVGVLLALCALLVNVFIEPDLDTDKELSEGNSSDYGKLSDGQAVRESSDQNRLVEHWKDDNHMAIAGMSSRIITHDPMRHKQYKAVMTKTPSFGKSLNAMNNQTLEEAHQKLIAANNADGKSYGTRNEESFVKTGENNLAGDDGPTVSGIDLLSTRQKRFLGVGMAILSGVFYGSNFIPNTLEGNRENDTTGLHFVFSHFTGILCASTFYMLVYSIYSRNMPFVNRQLIVPAFCSGVLWAIAQTGWFVANDNLSLAISFPIITSGPGLVASAWGVFWFKEIIGRRNQGMLLISLGLTIISGVCVGMSKS